MEMRTSRRLFFKWALAALGLCAGIFRTKGARSSTSSRSSKVILVRRREVLGPDRRPDVRIIGEMLDEAVVELTGNDKPLDGWASLLGEARLVGIKSNVWYPLPTPREVEEAIIERLTKVGVARERIRVDDRGARKTLSTCTDLINVRPLRTHHWAGIGGCIKNYIMFVRTPFLYHPNACAKLGHIWTLPEVKGKTRLNVLLVLTPLYHGRGPHHFNPAYIWDYRGIMVSRDPVAADAMGVELLKAMRMARFGEERPFPNTTHHIQYAERIYRIGVSDPQRIELVKRGWMDGALI
jgi:hypothetical protein